MAKKNNIRSIRFSDELADLIDRQNGRTFTEKLENLVTLCVWEIPQREEQLKHIQTRIEQERKKLINIQEQIQLLIALEADLKNIQRDFEIIKRRADLCAKAAMEDELQYEITPAIDDQV